MSFIFNFTPNLYMTNYNVVPLSSINFWTTKSIIIKVVYRYSKVVIWYQMEQLTWWESTKLTFLSRKWKEITKKKKMIYKIVAHHQFITKRNLVDMDIIPKNRTVKTPFFFFVTSNTVMSQNYLNIYKKNDLST